MGKYDDIINLPHPKSRTHPHMPVSKRAAQFAPFAALSGYEEKTEITANTRLMTSRVEPGEDKKEEIDAALRILSRNPGRTVKVTYFEHDVMSDSGRYSVITGTVRRISGNNSCLELEDGVQIRFEDIWNIDFDTFV